MLPSNIVRHACGIRLLREQKLYIAHRAKVVGHARRRWWAALLAEDRSAYFPSLLLPLPAPPTGVGSFFARPADTQAMLPRTRQFLARPFKPFNEQLAKMLGDDGFLWND